MGGASGRFHTTLWGVVHAAGNGAPEALEELLAGYWKPVYLLNPPEGVRTAP